ncbi:Bug family tripartite tricarboxylate transporter substrate binding protein [Elioraea rosea]|uniref:Bug family tripartite tricarboxylate transporter substrate binding protein n=1 Tax=Elioraea rosea TaxID=2492390 RepID=UPI00118465C0|nr:tripartite tricarboxylate transporter substrate binding protein [Elioraea rosea]
MMIRRRSLLAGTAGAGAAALLAPSARAQAWSPTRPVTVLVPFVAGGPSDIIARVIAAKMQLGQPVVAENRPGANGSVAGQMLARAQPDGYAFLVGSIGVFAINKALRGASIGYDPEAFTPITLAVTTPNVLTVHPSSPAKNLQEFVAWLKANPGKFGYSTSGVGASDHLTMELFKQRTGTDITHIPYQGGAAAATDLIAGNVHATFQNMPTIHAHVANGRMRALAVTAPERHPQMPDVPTMAEQGMADFNVTSWQAMMGPANLPANIRDRVAAEARKALMDPEAKDRLTKMGFDVVATTPEALKAFQADEVRRWTEVVRTAKIEAA